MRVPVVQVGDVLVVVNDRLVPVRVRVRFAGWIVGAVFVAMVLGAT